MADDQKTQDTTEVPGQPPTPNAAQSTGTAAMPSEVKSVGQSETTGTQAQYTSQSTMSGVPPVPGGQPVGAPAGNGKATAALVCGILAIVTVFIPIVSIILGIVAIVLGVQVGKVGIKGKSKGAIACGAIGIVLSVIMIIISAFAGMAVFSAMMDTGSSTPKVSSSSSSSTTTPPSSSSTTTPSGDSTGDSAAAEKAAASFLDSIKDMSQADKDSFASGIALGFEQSSGVTMADIGFTKEEFTDWIVGGTDYTIVDTMVNDDGTAQVKATVTSHDAASLMSTFEDEITAFTSSPEASTITEDQTYAKVGELLRSSMDKTAAVPKTVYLDLTKAGDNWTVDSDSQLEVVETVYAYGA